MAELDPLTNLPKDRTDPVKDSEKPSFEQRRASFKQNKDLLRGTVGRQVPGTFGEYGPDNVITSNKNFNQIRAKGQSTLGLIGKAAAQSAGTVVGMGLEAVGYLADIPQAINHIVNGSEMDFERNFLSEAGNNIEEYIKDELPIYTTDEVNNGEWGRFFDGTYWASNAPSISSTLALMIPAGAIGQSASFIARAMKAGKMGQRAAMTVGASVGSRHMENMLEAQESYEQIYQRALDEGKNTEEARFIAGDAAAGTYRRGYVNLATDMLQWGALARGFDFANRGTKATLAQLSESSGYDLIKAVGSVLKRNPSLTIKDAVKKAGFDWKDYLAQSAMEGVEEFNQEFIKRVSAHNADIALGLTDGRAMGYGQAIYSGLMKEHVGESETWDAALMGFLGGAVFQGAGAIASARNNRVTEADNARVMKAEQEKIGYIQDTLEKINGFMQTGETERAERERQNLVFSLAINGMNTESTTFGGSAIEGRLGNTIEMFEAIKNMNQEERELFRLGEDSDQLADKVIEDLQDIGERINKEYNNTNISQQLDGPLSIMKAEHSWRIDKATESLGNIDSQIDEILTDKSTGELFKAMDPEQQTLAQEYMELQGLQSTIKALEEAPDTAYGPASYRVKIMKKAKKEMLADLRQRETELGESIRRKVKPNQSKFFIGNMEFSEPLAQPDVDAIISDEKSKEVKAALNNLKESKLNELYENKAQTQAEIISSKTNLKELSNPDIHADILKAMEQTDEQLKMEAATNFIKSDFEDGEFIRFTEEVTDKDGNVTEETNFGRLRIDGDQIELMPIDREGNVIGELQPVKSVKSFERILRAEAINYDRFMTQEQFDERVKFFRQNVKDNNFNLAFEFLSDFVYQSNFSDRAKGLMDELMEGFKEHLDSINDVDGIIDAYNNFQDMLPSHRLNQARAIISDRAQRFQEELNLEMQAVSEQITAKERKFREQEEKLEQAIESAEILRQGTEQRIESIFNELVEMEDRGELTKLDRRTKPAKALEKLEADLDQIENNLKEQRKNIEQEQKQILKDIKVLNKLYERLQTTKETGRTIIEREMEEAVSEMEYIKSRLLIDHDIALDSLETLSGNYTELYDKLDKAIIAIEKFREHTKTINDASGVIRKATRRAYNDLLEEGLLSQSDSVLGGVSEYIFDAFRVKFNKYLTEEIKKIEDSDTSAQVKRYANETRLKADTFPSDVNYWAAFDIDFPVFSELFQSEELAEIANASNDLKRFADLRAKYNAYQGVLANYRKILRNQAQSVEGRIIKGTKKTKREDNEDYESFVPQRTIFTAFNRLGGNSGDMSAPNDDPSQRRYFRYVNKTNFSEKEHQVELMLAPEEYDVPEEYNKDEVIIAKLTDADGNYLKEDGTTTPEFSFEENLYTTVVEPTYKIPGSEYNRTFTPSANYLKKFFAGKNQEERLNNYEKEKERLKEAYRQQKNQWVEALNKGESVVLGISGKSKGVDNQNLENPKTLDTIFDTDQLDFIVPTSKERIYKGDVIHAPKGSVIIVDKKKGNIHQGHRRELNNDEKNTIVQALRSYVENSTIKKNGVVNLTDEQQKRAGLLTDKQGNTLTRTAFGVIKDLVYSFEDTAPIQLQGHELIIGNKAIQLYAQNSEGQWINKLNPEIVKELKSALDGMDVQVASAPLNNEESQSHVQIVYKNGDFQSQPYESYEQYVIDNDLVQTYLEKPEKMPNGEEGYISYNQNLIIGKNDLDLGESDNLLKDRRTPETKGSQGPSPSGILTEGDTITSIEQLNNKKVIVESLNPKAPVLFSVEVANGEIDIRLLPYTDIEMSDEYRTRLDEYEQGGEMEKAIARQIEEGKFRLRTIVKDLSEPTKEETGKDTIEETPPWEEPKEEEAKEVKSAKPAEDHKEAQSREDLSPEDQKLYDEIRKETEADNTTPEEDQMDWFRFEGTGFDLTDKQFNKIAGQLKDSTGVDIVVQSKSEGLDTIAQYSDEQFTLEDMPSGMYFRGVAYIFTDGQVNSETLFHEVGHAIVDQIMDQNPALAAELYNDIASSEQGLELIKKIEKGYKAKTFEGDVPNTSIIGEIITTVLGKASSDSYADRTTVQKILDAIKNFFLDLFNIDTRVNELSENTTIGELADMMASATPIQTTPTLISNQRAQFSRNDLKLEGKSVKFTSDTMKMMNYLFFDGLFSRHSDKLNVLFTEDSGSKLYNDLINYAEIKITIKKDVARHKEKTMNVSNAYSQSVRDMEYVLNNWQEVVELHQRNLKRFNVEVITEDTFSDSVEKDSNKLFQDNHVTFSAKQNATSAIRFLIGSLKSNKYNDTFPAFNESVDFGKIFNILANHLSGTTTLKEKKDIIEQVLGRQEGMQNLLSRTLNKKRSDITKADVNLLLQFNEAFSKHNNQYRLAFSDAGTTFKLEDATINTAKTRVKQLWKSSSRQIKPLYKYANNAMVYNTDYINNQFPKELKNISLNKRYTDRLKNVRANKYNQYEYYYKQLQFLEGIGIDVTAYDVLPSSDFTTSVDHMFNMIRTGKGKNVFTSEGDMKGDLNRIIEHQIENSVDTVENQHMNLENETVYNVVLNHYVSLIEDKLNRTANLDEFLKDNPHLNSDYTKNSIILNRTGNKGRLFNKVFGENGDRTVEVKAGKTETKPFNINITGGIKGIQKSVSFDQLDHSDKIRLHMNSIMSGQYPLFRAGDKKLERFIELGELLTIEEIRNDNHTSLFSKYLMDELDYIRKNKEYLSQFAGVKDLVDNPIENSIMMNMVAGNKKLKKSMLDYINGNVAAMDAQAINTASKQIKQHFENQIDETIDYLEEFMIVEKQGDRYINNGLLGLTENKMKHYTRSQLEDIVRKVIINESIANVEQTKLFTGHPSFYKGTNNFFHRMSGALGTKKVSAVGHGENTLLNNFFPSKQRMYTYTDNNGNLQKTTSYSPSENTVYKPIMRTAVFQDPTVRSRNYKEIKDILDNENNLEAYDNMEEPDAIGLVSLDSYRDMKLRNGEWTEALERLYQWETRPKGAKEIEFENWTTKEIEKVTEKDLVNTNGKRTTFNMLKPQYFGPLAEKDFIPGMYKLAMLPVLPSYLRETTEDGSPKYPSMQKLSDYMDESKVGLVTFETANKVGVKDPGQPLYNDQGQPQFDVTTQDTYFEYWGLQLQTGNSVKDSVILGSQFMKQILSGIYDQGQAPKDLHNLASEMTRTHNRLIEMGVNDLKKELGLTLKDGKYEIDGIKELISFLVDEAEQRDANNNVIQGLSDLENLLNAGIGLDVLSNRDKVENILASIADSRAISQNVHGGAKVQAPSTFFETSDRVKDDNGNLLSNELEFYGESGVMEVYLPHYFKEILADHPQIKEGSQLLKAIGFRIPTSGLNVIENIKIKGFLPQSAGETIVLPSDIVGKAGSDYDVDKLNILLPNYTMYKGQPSYIKPIRTSQDVVDIVKEASEVLDGKAQKSLKESIKSLKQMGYPKVADLLRKQGRNLTKALQNPKTKKVKEIQPTEDVKELFKINSKLSDTGTPVQYQAYLETVFPNSKVKDILYHFSLDSIEEFTPKDDNTYGAIFFTPEINSENKNMIAGLTHELSDVNTHAVIINAENPGVFSLGEVSSPNEQIPEKRKKHDVLIGTRTEKRKLSDLNIKENTDDAPEIAVQDVSKIHILGSPKDVKSFKSFINSGNTPIDIEGLNTKQGLQNKLIEISSEIISNKANRKSLLTPIGIDILDNIKEEIDGIRGETYANDYTTMLTNFKYLTRITQRNIESIAGTGISALHVSDHVHATRYNYYMSPKMTLELPHNEYEGNISLAGKTDVENNHEIGNVLNQITNMFIDGVKNPISFSLNLNLSTAPTALFLIRAGVPTKHVMYMLNQPAVREYTKLKAIQNSIANERRKNDNGNYVQMLTNDKIDRILKSKFGTSIKTADFTAKEMKDQLSSPSNGIQRAYLQEFKNAENHGKVLNEYVNHTRIDTTAMGKNTSQLELMLRDLYNISKGIAVINSSKVVDNTMDSDTPGFLHGHYQALKEFREMFQPFFSHYSDPIGSELYDNMVNHVSTLDGLVDDKVRLLDRFKSDMLTYRLMNSNITINGQQYAPIKTDIENMMVGDNSLPRRIAKFRETSDNLLIEYLLPILSMETINGKHYDNLKLVDQRLDITEQNELIEAWRDLFNTHPNLAADLSRFTIMQSGLQLSPVTFTKFIPQEIFSEMMQSVASHRLNKQHFLQSFIENNYNDDLLVPAKWGRKPPKGAKLWKILERTNATDEQINQGARKYKPVPTIIIPPSGLMFGEETVYEDTGRARKIKPRGFKDYRESRSLQAFNTEVPTDDVTMDEAMAQAFTKEELLEDYSQIGTLPKAVDYNPTNIPKARREELANQVIEKYGKPEITEVSAETDNVKAKITRNKIEDISIDRQSGIAKGYKFKFNNAEFTIFPQQGRMEGDAPISDFFGMAYLAEQQFKEENKSLDKLSETPPTNPKKLDDNIKNCKS